MYVGIVIIDVQILEVLSVIKLFTCSALINWNTPWMLMKF